jgi:NDP-sugar pyrophosphorylase family protein
MVDNKVRQIPIVDSSKTIVGLSLWEDFNEPSLIKNKLLIMAGGRGIRMLPLTNDLPKPMCKVGDKPILEHIIQRARRQGLTDILISINYLGEIIEEYFGDGSKFGVNIDYIKEEEPIGTAGALGLIDRKIEFPLFVMNGDLITEVNFIGLLDFHNRNKSCGTMVVRNHEYQVPFGVVSVEGSNIEKIEEKPKIHSLINAGLYLIDAKMLSLVDGALYLDMPELFQKAIKMKWNILAYPIYEQWFDVGTPTDLKKAHDAFNGE